METMAYRSQREAWVYKEQPGINMVLFVRDPDGQLSICKAHSKTKGRTQLCYKATGGEGAPALTARRLKFHL